MTCRSLQYFKKIIKLINMLSARKDNMASFFFFLDLGYYYSRKRRLFDFWLRHSIFNQFLAFIYFNVMLMDFISRNEMEMNAWWC